MNSRMVKLIKYIKYLKWIIMKRIFNFILLFFNYDRLQVDDANRKKRFMLFEMMEKKAPKRMRKDAFACSILSELWRFFLNVYLFR